jgi:hypothetical protein
VRKLKEVLRLRFELKLGYQQIARSCAIAASSVHKYLKRAEAAGVTWPLPEDWDEARVEGAVFPPPGTSRKGEESGTYVTRCVWQLKLVHFGGLIWPTPKLLILR